MLPDGKLGKGLYMESRDYRNRWRESFLRTCKDPNEFKVYCLEDVMCEADLACFKEVLDFAIQEEFLTCEMMQAAHDLITKAKELRALILPVIK